MKNSDKNFNVETRMTQLGRNPDETYGFVNQPIYRGSTVIYQTLESQIKRDKKFYYGTAGTPTIESLENAWTELTGAKGTVLSPSGLGSITLALLAVLKSGDHLLMTDSAYGPTRTFCDNMLKRLGIETTYYDPMIGADIETIVKSNTRVIFLEAPASQTFEVQDVPAIVKVAKKHGIKTIIDNTWATPLFFKAHEFGIDITVEAGTKYLGGHSDLLLGLTTANEESWADLRDTYDYMAMLPGAEDCFLALRGLRTMHLRLKEAEKRALEIANWLKTLPEISTVLHPALPECPGHEIWKRDFTGSSGLFTVVLNPKYTMEDLARMMDGYSLFGMGFSWGGYESLITYFDCTPMRTATKWKPEGITVRIQIGLEDINDLKDDLALGFIRLNDK